MNDGMSTSDKIQLAALVVGGLSIVGAFIAYLLKVANRSGDTRRAIEEVGEDIGLLRTDFRELRRDVRHLQRSTVGVVTCAARHTTQPLPMPIGKRPVGDTPDPEDEDADRAASRKPG